MADPVASNELVDPYAAALATAYQLAPEGSEAEGALEQIFDLYCDEKDIDGHALLESIGARINELCAGGRS